MALSAAEKEMIRDLVVRIQALERQNGFEISKLALDKATDALIEVRALKQSTHQVVAMPSSSIKEFEEQITKLNGNMEDFDKDLQAHGFSEDAEDTV